MTKKTTIITYTQWRGSISGHFGDKSFQAIDCTGTDNQKQGKKTLRTSLTGKTNREKPGIANKTNY